MPADWTLSYVADVSSLVGLAITVVGFWVTVHAAIKSRKAAERAEAAAKAARSRLLKLDAIQLLASVIAILEEVKRLHRDGEWSALPEKYGTARRSLIEIRSTELVLAEEQGAIVQGAIAQLATIEKKVEQRLADPTIAVNAPKLNALISQQSDGLTKVLTELRNSGGEDDN